MFILDLIPPQGVANLEKNLFSIEVKILLAQF